MLQTREDPMTDPGLVYYLSHPVSPQQGETYSSNIELGKAWFSHLARLGVPVIAPHFTLLETLDDTNPSHRALGMSIVRRVVSRCTGIITVGVRYSVGMRSEIEVAIAHRLEWYDWVGNAAPCLSRCDAVKRPSPPMEADEQDWIARMEGNFFDVRKVCALPGNVLLMRCEGACSVERIRQGSATQ